MCVCVCLYLGMCTRMKTSPRPEKGVGSPGTGVPGSYELSDVGAEN